jgi:hypothetical protein
MKSMDSSPTVPALSPTHSMGKESELKELEERISEIEHELKNLSFTKAIAEVTAKSDDRKVKHDERIRYAQEVNIH